VEFKTALEYIEQHAVAMLSTPGAGLLAVAVSSKEQGPITATKDFSVTAYVEKKLAVKEIKNRNMQTFEQVFAHATGEKKPQPVDIDVVETGSAFALQPSPVFSVPTVQRGVYGGLPPIIDSQKYFNPLCRGIGITNPDGSYPASLSVGTLGFFVRDSNNKVHLVSNNHVIGKSSDHSAVKSVLQNPIVQPGTLDLTAVELASMPTLTGLKNRLQIATVSGIVPLQFITAHNIPINRVDAACALLDGPNSRTLTDLDRACFGGRILGTQTYQPDSNAPNTILGDPRVYKVGRTTGYTEGIITAIAGTTSINYPGGTAYFAGQLIVSATPNNVGPFSDRGDSGSGILNADHKLVGLLFAGSTLQTLVNPIDDVLSELQAALGVAWLTEI